MGVWQNRRRKKKSGSPAYRVRYKKGVFIQLLLLPLIAILIVGAGSYQIHREEMGKRLDITLEAAAEQLENRIDNVVYNVCKKYLETADHTAVKKLADQNAMDIFYAGLKDTLSELQDPYYLSDYISGYSLVNIRYGWVLSNRGLYALEDAINREAVEELFEEASALYSQNSYWKNQIETLPEQGSLNRLEVNLRGLCRVIKVPLLTRECDMLLIVNLNMQQLAGLVCQGTGEYGMTILDDSGELVYTDQPLVGEYCRQSGSGEKSSQMESGMVVLENGSHMRLAVKRSRLSGWIYVASYDRDIISGGGRGILVLVLLMAVAVLVEFVLAYYGTQKIYSPIKQLLSYTLHFEKARGRTGTDTSDPPRVRVEPNEFTYISRTMKHLADSNTDLEEVVAGQKVYLQELLVRRILSGEVQSDGISERAIQLGVYAEKYLYVVTTVVRLVSKEIKAAALEETRKDILSLEFVDNMPKELVEDLLIGPFWNGSVIFSLLTADDAALLEDKVLAYQRDMSVYALSCEGIVVYSGVSNVFEDLADLKRAYGESTEALKNNELLKKDGAGEREDKYDLVFFADFTARHKSTLRYDMDFEARIKEAVADCNEEEAGAITDEFVDSLIESRVVLQERTLALYRYMIAILATAGQAGLSANEIFENSERDLFLRLSGIYEWEGIRFFYKKKVIHPIVDRLKEFREGMVDSVLNQVISLVKERQGNITLGECAERLGHHPSYIWKVMTSRINMTFSEYLASYKLGLAKQMLLETDMTVSEIAEKLNYTSAQNFNRFFVKYENVSPGKYRKMNRG